MLKKPECVAHTLPALREEGMIRGCPVHCEKGFASHPSDAAEPRQLRLDLGTVLFLALFLVLGIRHVRGRPSNSTFGYLQVSCRICTMYWTGDGHSLRSQTSPSTGSRRGTASTRVLVTREIAGTSGVNARELDSITRICDQYLQREFMVLASTRVFYKIY